MKFLTFEYSCSNSIFIKLLCAGFEGTGLGKLKVKKSLKKFVEKTFVNKITFNLEKFKVLLGDILLRTV